MPKTKFKNIEAMDIVIASIEANKKKGTADYKTAEELHQKLIKLWKKQFWARHKNFCPHCGHKLYK